MHRGAACLAVLLVAVLAACSNTSSDSGKPPDRQPQLDQLTQQLQHMPGVASATNELVNDPSHGQVYFNVEVQLADDVTGAQLGAITGRYLDNLRTVNYAPYKGNLRARRGFDYFAVDSGSADVSNVHQIEQQANSWVDMLHEFGGAIVYFRPTIVVGNGASVSQAGNHASTGTITISTDADYTAVATTFATLAAKFPDLTSGEWKVIAGKSLGGGIETSGRMPNQVEIDVWNRLNGDQVIPHIDVMSIDSSGNGPPLWVSEGPQSADPDIAIRLARAHLPIVATLPAPILYTASDQMERRLDNQGRAVGPVAITIGGCTRRAYQPGPAEQELIDQYEKCR
ncbi:MAG: hypothetical protein QOE41_4434 [Mycobacterium sp.]|jgi:hypothetical protein|nr:hypothetical protein [Mycobacterium sp.]MDT5135123.1 hypothetical protein [Mycobacterium sp.]